MAKRKSQDSKLDNKKPKKSTTNSGIDSSEITRLTTEIIESAKVNNLVTLLNEINKVKSKLISSVDEKTEQIGRELAVALFKSFQHLLKQGKLKFSASDDEKKQLVSKWIEDKYSGFKQTINEFIVAKLTTETSLQLDLLQISLNLIKLESIYLNSKPKDPYFPIQTYKDLVHALLTSEAGEIMSDGSNDNFIVLEFVDTFEKHWDLQFYLFNNLFESLNELKQEKSTQQLQTIFSIFYTIIKNKLLYTNDVEQQQELASTKWISGKLPSIASKPSHFKAQYQKAIVSILSYPLLNSQYKSTLLILHKRIMPYMQQPQSLLDFLTDAYDIENDIIPLLTLNSLYELMRSYNLEYPDFYTKLYSLLTPSLMQSRYRSRFFRLVDLFLTSTHLSANLVASFIKRLARLSIASGSPSTVIVIPFIYNLLKRHPTCMIMIHNTNVANKSSSYEDQFDPEEQDPLKTQAINSSLWEVETLMSHYHPNIATLAKIFGEPFRKHSYNMEDFLDWNFQTLLDAEKTRKYKGVAALEFETFDKVFATKDATSVYAQGWTL